MEQWQPGMADPLPELARTLPSVQLPCYVYLCMHDPSHADTLRRTPLWDAALVQLADRGDEIPLLGDGIDNETRNIIMQERIPALLRFLLRHMATATEFSLRRTERCARCPYQSCCR